MEKEKKNYKLFSTTINYRDGLKINFSFRIEKGQIILFCHNIVVPSNQIRLIRHDYPPGWFIWTETRTVINTIESLSTTQWFITIIYYDGKF